MSVRHPAEINGKGFQRRDQPVGCYGGQQVLHLLHILRRGSAGCHKEGGTMPETAVLPVSDEKLTHVIYPEKIVYVDFGNTTVQVEKAENVNNIVAFRGRVAVCPADQPYSHHRKRQVLYI